jgi:outer membrane protein assembly factor BamB
LEKDLQLKQLWRTPIFEEPRGTAESIYPVQVGDMAFTSKLLDNFSPIFYGLDMKHGSILWQVMDTSCTGKVYYNMAPFISKHGMVIPYGEMLKSIDYKTGKSLWSYQYMGNPEQFLEPYTNKTFLQAVNDWDERKSHIFKVNSLHGVAKCIYTFNWPDSSKLLIRTPVKVDEGQVLFTSITMRYSTNETHAKWHLLNLSTDEIKSEGAAYPDNKDGYGVTKQPKIIGDKALMVAYDNVFCISTTNGKELWRKALPRDMLTAVPIASKDGLFCPMEDGNLYKLSLDDGNIIWKAEISATPSRPIIVNDYLFIVGGSDGILYVISTKDGRTVKSMKAPNHQFVKNQFFRRFIGVDFEGETLILFDGNSFRGYKIWQ